MLNDPLANALSLMKNAELRGKGTCRIQPSSKLIGGILNLLREKEYISEFEFIDDGKAGAFDVTLKGTTTGVVSHQEAKKQGIGGKVLAYIY